MLPPYPNTYRRIYRVRHDCVTIHEPGENVAHELGRVPWKPARDPGDWSQARMADYST